MNKIEITGTVKTKPHLYFYSETPQLFLCRFIVLSDNNLFPILCFNEEAKEVADNMNVNDMVHIQGILQDFSYNDCNLARHTVKILLASSVECITAEDVRKDGEIDEIIHIYHQMINKGFEILDFEERQILIRK